MSLKLISHVNADSDLIEAWLKYYLGLGVTHFHLVVHGPTEDNSRLLALKDSYPIIIEDTYGGSFDGDEKKRRLDAVLARCTDQWVLLVDSDEFVEFPYRDIPETIEKLDSANANVMFAPMLQRLTADGSLETPPTIDSPFKVFPLCSVDLYRRMGVKADIFKFPLFFCSSGTELAQEGNHFPPLGREPRATNLLGVTHHFKFRRTVSDRLDRRINSAYQWRHESVQFREYLESHSDRLPLDGAFPYSREELFRRGLLRELSPSKLRCPKTGLQPARERCEKASANPVSPVVPNVLENQGPRDMPVAAGKRIAFVIPKTNQFGGLERHLLDLLNRLHESHSRPLVICFDQDVITAHMNPELQANVDVECVKEPRSLLDWIRLIRTARADIIVFSYSWIEAFPWQAPVAALLAGMSRRLAIQHLIPAAQPQPVSGSPPANLLRRLMGKRARHRLGLAVAAHTFSKIICVSNAVRDALVGAHNFPAKRTVTVYNGVSTSSFSPSKTEGAAVRARFGIGPDEFLLVCAARLAEAKGIDILLHAVSRVLRQGIACKCIIVGNGPLKEKLMQQANALGLWDSVFFEGFQEDVRPYLNAASAFILTSHLEGLPLSVLEAMACGTPCIVTSVGGSAEAVEDKVVGLVIPPASVDAAEDAILYLATHPCERAEMASKTRERVCRGFSLENRIGELSDVVLG